MVESTLLSRDEVEWGVLASIASSISEHTQAVGFYTKALKANPTNQVDPIIPMQTDRQTDR